MRTRLATLAGLVAAIVATPVCAQMHPNESIYRYRVKDYVLQGPWHSYPEERERSQWDCFDDATKRAIDCARAAVSLDRFRYIFRLRYLDDRQPTGGLW